MTEPNYKDKLYSSYISTGQTANDYNSKKMFSKRKYSHTKIIKRYLPKNKKSKIIDLGCGHGSLIHFTKLAGYKNVKGIDLSQEEVNLAHELGIPEIQQGNIVDFLSSTQEKFDAIFLMDVLEHIESSDAIILLEKINNVLNPGGRLILHVPNGEGLFGMRIRYGDFTHENAFTLKSLKQILTSTGYNNILGYEEKPIVHGFISLIRRLIWDVLTIRYRLLMMAETGLRSFILSQNLMVTAEKK